MKQEMGTNTAEFWNVPCARCHARIGQPCMLRNTSRPARDTHTPRIRLTLQRLQARIPEIPRCDSKSDLGGLVCHLDSSHDGLHHDEFDGIWWQSEDEHEQG